MATQRQPALEHRARNLMHSVLLIGGMILLASALGWGLGWGRSGLLFMAAAAGLFLLVGPRVSPRLIFRMYRAQPLAQNQAPALAAIVEELSKRAKLSRTPQLYYIPSRLVNAFAAGSPADAGIGVTDGILHNLTLRELAGVLAHEISHLRHNDLWVMGLADLTTRMVNTFAWIGQLLLFINLPAMLMGRQVFAWPFIVLLILAPTLSALLQLALSRTREFNADVGAAELTGDPRGLASALAKMERMAGGFFERIFMPGRRIPEPSLLRTHPDTEERIRRLLELEGTRYEPAGPTRPLDSLTGIATGPLPRPRWHMSGLWR